MFNQDLNTTETNVMIPVQKKPLKPRELQHVVPKSRIDKIKHRNPSCLIFYSILLSCIQPV